MVKFKLDQIDEKTLTRLQALAEPTENADDVINRLINLGIGANCPHTKLAIYMEVIHDTNGYMNLEKTIHALTALRQKRSLTTLIRVCKQCMHARKIK